jgi:hypothetical protein
VNQNNQSKLVFNDTDHALGPAAFVNPTTGVIDDVNLRRYVWENFTSGASGVIFMDPYIISIPTNQRNPCASPVSGICANPLTKYDPFRVALGRVPGFAAQLDLLRMLPLAQLSSTTFCLASNVATGGEFVVYAPSGGNFTLDLSVQAGKTLSITWFDPTTGAVTNSGNVSGGSTTTPFTTPWGTAHDSVLYLVDTNGHL